MFIDLNYGYQLAMTDELEIHEKKQWERIEVLGLLDTRKLFEESFTEKSPEGHTKPKDM